MTNFNSRPSARGDAHSAAVRCFSAAFQFTPLREGRPSRPTARGSSTYFNSRPSARGDLSRRPGVRASGKFQFTPLREGRRQCAPFAACLPDFNSRPSARGDAGCITVEAVNSNFNSRPSARGDVLGAGAGALVGIFQFTPLREGRRLSVMLATMYNFISIHAPPRGATRAKVARSV